MQKFYLIFTAIVIIFITSCSNEPCCKSEQASVNENEETSLIENNASLNNVKKPEEVSDFTDDTKSTINLPLDSMEKKLSDIPKSAAKSNVENTISKNHLEIYAFHGTRQCETCKNMKANTRKTLDMYFSKELSSGRIVFSIIDVDDAENERLAEKFQATGTALMINNVINGKDNITDWSDFAFEKANDESVFIPELQTMINDALKKKNGNTTSIN